MIVEKEKINIQVNSNRSIFHMARGGYDFKFRYLTTYSYERSSKTLPLSKPVDINEGILMSSLMSIYKGNPQHLLEIMDRLNPYGSLNI